MVGCNGWRVDHVRLTAAGVPQREAAGGGRSIAAAAESRRVPATGGSAWVVPHGVAAMCPGALVSRCVQCVDHSGRVTAAGSRLLRWMLVMGDWRPRPLCSSGWVMAVSSRRAFGAMGRSWQIKVGGSRRVAVPVGSRQWRVWSLLHMARGGWVGGMGR